MLAFLDRAAELARLASALDRAEGVLVCVYGRRRLGKSRLIRRLLRDRPAVYYVGDDRDAALQRAAVAREVARRLPGFAAVDYPDWEPLLDRWWREAPRGAVLALDEFPALVATSPELPSLLQKRIDRTEGRGPSTLLCGSSQRMMHGLLLDAAAPLFGRARETLRVGPLRLRWLRRALRLSDPVSVVEHYAVWGGVPRYWELALDHPGLWQAVESLVLDPMGVLHREPERLLRDDLSELARAASILSLVGQGCHRISEIGVRLGVPATSLSRPLALLLDVGLIARDVPFGRSTRDTKRTLYRIADPLSRFAYRFLEPNRSRLAAGQFAQVLREVRAAWRPYLGEAWEQLARDSAACLRIAGRRWHPGSRWWGTGIDGQPIELDVVARAADVPDRILVGEAKLAATAADARRICARLRARVAACPALQGKRVTLALWLLRRPAGTPLRGATVVTAGEVVRSA